VGGSEDKQKAVRDDGLLSSVELDDCIFEVGDTKEIAFCTHSNKAQ
jgi:hypothetical protein